jgi:hypothetical protein
MSICELISFVSIIYTELYYFVTFANILFFLLIILWYIIFNTLIISMLLCTIINNVIMTAYI